VSDLSATAKRLQAGAGEMKFIATIEIGPFGVHRVGKGSAGSRYGGAAQAGRLKPSIMTATEIMINSALRVIPFLFTVFPPTEICGYLTWEFNFHYQLF